MKEPSGRITHDDAVRLLRKDPAMSDLIRDSYLDEDVHVAAERFAGSGEFQEVMARLGGVQGRAVLDLGSGNGIAAYAFAMAGAGSVVAMEPDAGVVNGRSAIVQMAKNLPQIDVKNGVAEAIPLDDGSVDVVFIRQVLHHVGDLKRSLAECARVLRPGGQLLVVREHVVRNTADLARFQADHPIHRLAGGEYAYPLDDYVHAIRDAGFERLYVIGPWDSVINAFPAVRSESELETYPEVRLREKLGRAGSILARFGLAARAARWRIQRPVPGRLYSFMARKPMDPAP